MKVTGYSKLQSLVNQGQLEMLCIVSPPRTMSTALEIAFTETGDGQIHEPFHIGISKDFNEGCEVIINRVKQLNQNRKGNPVRLIVKNSVKHLNQYDSRKFIKLSKECILVIREPSLQLYSLIKRRANDMDKYGSDHLPHEEIISKIPNIPNRKIMEKSWEGLWTIYKYTRKLKKPKVAILSSLSFRHNPRSAVENLKKHFKWNTTTDKILFNWTKGAGDNFYTPRYRYRLKGKTFASENAWTLDARKSNKFKPLDSNFDKPITLHPYPNKIKQYLLKTILPIYVKMITDNRNLSKPTIRNLIKPKNNQPGLLEINPIEAYVLLQSYSKLPDNLENTRNSTILKLKTTINNLYPEIATELFQITKQARIK